VAERLASTAFRAMGTDVEVFVLDGPDGLEARAAPAIERLEAKWSRFRPTSELCRLNAAGGAPVVVSKETLTLIERAVDAWRATDGRYDPTVLGALEAAGYDRDFDAVRAAPDTAAAGTEVAGTEVAGTDAGGLPTPGCAGITVDSFIGTVRVPPGVGLDLGGIGKGFAADLVAVELQEAGARGVLVNMGGDLRAVGDAPAPGAWVVEIDDPLATGRTGVVGLSAGAIATSTRLRRTWTRGGRALHHLIDPRTGLPAVSGVASITVIAGEAWRAEVLAKAAFIAGVDAGKALVEATGATGLFVTDAGEVVELAGLGGFRP
jgi:thiamine biosynthesis lipoprotein